MTRTTDGRGGVIAITIADTTGAEAGVATGGDAITAAAAATPRDATGTTSTDDTGTAAPAERVGQSDVIEGRGAGVAETMLLRVVGGRGAGMDTVHARGNAATTEPAVAEPALFLKETTTMYIYSEFVCQITGLYLSTMTLDGIASFAISCCRFATTNGR